MLRTTIRLLVTIAIIAVVYLTYEYNTELQFILTNIQIPDTASLVDKAKTLNEQLSGALATSGINDVLSGSEIISSGTRDMINTTSTVSNITTGTVAEIISGAREVISDTVATY
jgi:hypothetical protein